MKNLYSKTISVLLAALLTAGSFSTYAAEVNLDFEVESGEEKSYIADNTAVLSSEEPSPELDFDVEASTDVNQEILTDDYTVSLLGDDDYVFFTRGSGVENDPYLISSAQELLSIAFWVNNGAFTDAHYKLENDIDLGGAEWTPIGDYQNSSSYAYAFKGVFDGNGKTVSNFKITKPQIYAGLFGLINNATIKDLTVSDFNIDVEYAAALMYVGGIVGRARAIGSDSSVTIENCHVKGAKINAKSSTRIYGSGHSGYLHSSDGAELLLKGCSSDAECSFTVIDSNDNDGSDRSMIRAGGLIGYVGITDGKMSITGSSSVSSVFAEFSDISKKNNNDVHIGGFAGDFALSSASPSTRSSLTIDSCYSTNAVYAVANGDVYAGGFTGYLVSSASDVYISNCHTSSNVYSSSVENTSYIGGFTSITGIDTETPVGTIDIQCIYTAGNIIDIDSYDSIAGKFTSFILGEPAFKNCFSMSDTAIYAKSQIKADKAPETLFSKEQAAEINNYVGFDIDTWTQGTAPYSYPVLADNPLVHGKYKAYYFAEGAPVEYMTDVAYGSAAEMPSYLPDSHYVFSHWSLYKGGPDAIDGTYFITSGTIFFPNNSTEYKSYEISFSANGEIFDTASLKYSSSVVFPVAPPKPADSLFRYAFSHWSKTENGTAVNTDKETVKGNATYYAVYKKVETGVWDGISTNKYTNGTGTVDSPFEISDAYQLAYLASTVNDGTAVSGAYYVITKDIDLGGYEWTPIGTTEHPFTGILSGNGYSVYNFNITKPETVYAGLFGYAVNADISKLEVSGFRFNVQNEATVYAGPVAAYLKSNEENGKARISECYTYGEITVNAKVAYAGGIAGFAKDTDASVLSIEHSYSAANININSTANSTAGGILGNLQSENVGLSYINKCYYAGTISSLSPVACYGGGIIGFLINDDWADEGGVLSEEGSGTSGNVQDTRVIAAAVRNSFYAGPSITLSVVTTSYGGGVYGYKNSTATVINCGYIENASITAKNIAQNENVFKISKLSDLYDTEYVGEKFGFDFETLWVVKDKALPILQIFNQIKNVFKINEYALDATNGTIDVELKICYRDVESYLVLLGAYDERGKMIAFKSVSIAEPAELRTIEISEDGLDNAVSCTLSVINPKTMAFIEAPVTLTK